MSSLAPLRSSSNWSQLPTVHQQQICKMMKNDPKSIVSTELVCSSWKQGCDSWRKLEFGKIAPQDGELNLTIYPNITDSDIRVLFASIKKTEVRFSKWTKLVNYIFCNQKEELILVTSIDLSNCKNITDKTLKELEGFSITSLKLKNCKKITTGTIQSLLSSKKMSFVELP